MFFSIKSVVLSVFSMAITAQLAVAAPLLPADSNQLIPTLEAVRAISLDMHNILTSWSSASSSPQIVSAVAADFRRIDDRLTAELSVLTASKPYDDDASAVMSALDKFVYVHQKTLQTLIVKHEIVASFPFIAVPIGASLRSHEQTFDAFGQALLSVLPTREDQVTKDVNTLGALISQALATYS